jgi:iron complex outermembrane receptor protein
MDMLDHKVRLNLAGYMMDRTGTQIDFDYVDTAPYLSTGAANPNYNLHTENTANASGTSRIRGMEADLTINPIEHLTLGGSYAYTYANIAPTANPNPGPTYGVLTQVYVVYTPTNAASAFADYEVPVGGAGARARLHLDANYASSQYSFQAESTKTDASFIVNGRLAWPISTWARAASRSSPCRCGRATCSTRATSTVARRRMRPRWAITPTSTRRAPSASKLP